MIRRFTKKLKKFKAKLNLRRTLKLIWAATSFWSMAVIILVFFESAFFFASLYLLKLLINAVSLHGSANVHTISQYILLTALASVAYIIFKSLSGYATEVQGTKVTEYIDDRIHDAAASLDLSFYESPAYFDILKRAKDAGPDRPNAVVTNLVEICKNGLMLAAIGSVLISINWLLLPLLVLFVIPAMFVRIYFAEKLYEYRLRQTALERKSSYLGGLMTSDNSAKEIRSLGLGKYLRNKYNVIRTALLTERLKISKRSTFSEMIATIIATTGFYAAIGFIAKGVVTGKTSVGDITLFLVSFPQSFNLLQNLSGGAGKLYQNSIFVSDIFELFDLKPLLTDHAACVNIPAARNMDLEIKNLGFTYPHAHTKSLSGINMKIPSGKIIAVVGLNGAGKTTLIKLLSRLYDPTEGSIVMGGMDIRNFRIAEYRKQVSTVFQDFCRYNATVSDNIRFGDIENDRPPSEMIEAAQHSGAHGYIRKFPDGYDTMMGRLFEDGREVSIGQWQKLAIARALYSPAKFLIFDEATSALDALSERELFQSFREKIGDKAALIISHRVSAVEHADFIYVLADGRVKESGTHEELINAGGDYARLFTKKETTDVATKHQ